MKIKRQTVNKNTIPPSPKLRRVCVTISIVTILICRPTIRRVVQRRTLQTVVLYYFSRLNQIFSVKFPQLMWYFMYDGCSVCVLSTLGGMNSREIFFYPSVLYFFITIPLLKVLPTFIVVDSDLIKVSLF